MVKRYTPNKIANEIMAEDAWHDSEWVRASDYDALAAENAALRAELAFARSTGDESALEYHALKARLAEAERLLRLHYNDQAPANWGEQVRVFLAGVADSADATHLRGVLRDVAGFNFATLEDCVGAARAALAADGSRRATRSASAIQENKE